MKPKSLFEIMDKTIGDYMAVQYQLAYPSSPIGQKRINITSLTTSPARYDDLFRKMGRLLNCFVLRDDFNKHLGIWVVGRLKSTEFFSSALIRAVSGIELMVDQYTPSVTDVHGNEAKSTYKGQLIKRIEDLVMLIYIHKCQVLSLKYAKVRDVMNSETYDLIKMHEYVKENASTKTKTLLKWNTTS